MSWLLWAFAGYAIGGVFCWFVLGPLLRLRHRNHGRCSIYAPCRRADLERSWQEFRRAVDDPATRDATIRAELLRMTQGREPG